MEIDDAAFTMTVDCNLLYCHCDNLPLNDSLYRTGGMAIEESKAVFKNTLLNSDINFPAFMESHALGCIDGICQAIDFSPHKKVVDLGGKLKLSHCIAYIPLIDGNAC